MPERSTDREAAGLTHEDQAVSSGVEREGPIGSGEHLLDLVRYGDPGQGCLVRVVYAIGVGVREDPACHVGRHGDALEGRLGRRRTDRAQGKEAREGER